MAQIHKTEKTWFSDFGCSEGRPSNVLGCWPSESLL